MKRILVAEHPEIDLAAWFLPYAWLKNRRLYLSRLVAVGNDDFHKLMLACEVWLAASCHKCPGHLCKACVLVATHVDSPCSVFSGTFGGWSQFRHHAGTDFQFRFWSKVIFKLPNPRLENLRRSTSNRHYVNYISIFKICQMILVFTGDGKGKTTSALGQAVRAIGDGKKVLMIQFIKGPWRSGEDYVDISLKEYPPALRRGSGQAGSGPSAFRLMKVGMGFVGILGDKLPIEEHKKAAEDGLALAKKEIESGKWDMVILDEINNAVHLGLVVKEKVLELINLSTGKLENLILTGRDAPQEFIDAADIVTEMKEIKHTFQKEVKAKHGLEY